MILGFGLGVLFAVTVMLLGQLYDRYQDYLVGRRAIQRLRRY